MSGITDPSEQYFKDGGWSWNGSIWIKGGLPFEYAGNVLGRVIDDAPAAGMNYVVGAAVPADEIWVITTMHVYDATSALDRVLLAILRGGAGYNVAVTGALAAGYGYSWVGNAYLEEDDAVRATLYGVVAYDYLRFGYTGYKMRLT